MAVYASTSEATAAVDGAFEDIMHAGLVSKVIVRLFSSDNEELHLNYREVESEAYDIQQEGKTRQCDIQQSKDLVS